MSLNFTQTGWSRINFSSDALDPVERMCGAMGVPVQPFDVKPHLAGFRAHLQLPEYSGEYRIYGGPMFHCLLEKALEHYLSFVLAEPMPGQTAVDVGSCKSVVPEILRRVHNVQCYEQDLEYSPGVHGNRVGSSADAIPLPDRSIDFTMLHCTFEHFEGNADTGFVRESARLLKPGGRTIILPLYLNENYCNVTGETDPAQRAGITFDSTASFHCVIPEWKNRFGRHYSPPALLTRVIAPAREAGLNVTLHRVKNWDLVDAKLWLRWILVLEQPR